MYKDIKKGYFLFNTFRSTAFLVPILFVYIRDQLGLTISEILILSGLYNLVPFILEVPLGFIADKIGNKKIIILGLLFQILSCLGLLLFDGKTGYQIYLFSIYIAAASFSGADKTLLNQHITDAKEFKHFLVDVNKKLYKYTIILILLGSITFQVSPTIPLLLQIACFCISLYGIMTIPERPFIKQTTSNPSLANSLNFLIKDHAYLALMFLSGLYAASIMINHKTIQLLFVDSIKNYFNISTFWLLGFFYAIGNFFSYKGLDVYKKYKLTELNFRKQNLIFTALLCISFLLFSINNIAAIFFGFLIINVFKSMYRPIVGAELTTRISINEYKTTILSIASLLTALITTLIHIGFSNFFKDMNNGSFLYISVIVPITLILIYFSGKDCNYRIFLFKKKLTGKKNYLGKEGSNKFFIQKYPSEIHADFFNRLAWSTKKTTFPHPITDISEGKVVSKYLPGLMLKDIPNNKHFSLVEDFFSSLALPEIKKTKVSTNYSPVLEQLNNIGFTKSELEKLNKDRYWTIIHGDLHPENIFIDKDDKMILIDWDLSGEGWFWFDMFTLLTSPLLKISTQKRVTIFNEYYKELSEGEILSLMKTFISYKVEQINKFISYDPSFTKIKDMYSQLELDFK